MIQLTAYIRITHADILGVLDEAKKKMQASNESGEKTFRIKQNKPT